MPSQPEPTLCNRFVAFLFGLITLFGLRVTILNRVLFFPPKPSSYTILTGYNDNTVEAWPPLRKDEDNAGAEELKRRNFDADQHTLKKKIIFQFNHNNDLSSPYSTPNVFIADVPIPYIQFSEQSPTITISTSDKDDKNKKTSTTTSLHATWQSQYKDGYVIKPEHLQPNQTTQLSTLLPSQQQQQQQQQQQHAPPNLLPIPPNHKPPTTVSLLFIPYPVLQPQISNLDSLPFSTQQSYILTPSIYNQTPQKINYSTTTIFFSHGNATDVGQLYEWCYALSQQFQANIALYDYLGYGASQGKTQSPKNLLASGENALLYVLDNFRDRTKDVILYGQSIGSTVTCHLGYKFCNITPPSTQLAYQREQKKQMPNFNNLNISPSPSLPNTGPIFYHKKYNTTQKALSRHQRDVWLEKFKIESQKEKELHSLVDTNPHNRFQVIPPHQPYIYSFSNISPLQYQKYHQSSLFSSKDDSLTASFSQPQFSPTNTIAEYIYPLSNYMFNYVYRLPNMKNSLERIFYQDYSTQPPSDLSVLQISPSLYKISPSLPKSTKNTHLRRKSLSSLDFNTPLNTPHESTTLQPPVSPCLHLADVEIDSLNKYLDYIDLSHDATIPKQAPIDNIFIPYDEWKHMYTIYKTNKLDSIVSVNQNIVHPLLNPKLYHAFKFDRCAIALSQSPSVTALSSILTIPLRVLTHHPSTPFNHSSNKQFTFSSSPFHTASLTFFPFTPSLQLSSQCHLPAEFNAPISTDPKHYHFSKWLPDYIIQPPISIPNHQFCSSPSNSFSSEHPYVQLLTSTGNTIVPSPLQTAQQQQQQPQPPLDDAFHLDTHSTVDFQDQDRRDSQDRQDSQKFYDFHDAHTNLNEDNADLHEFSVLVSSKFNPNSPTYQNDTIQSQLRPISLLEHQQEFNDVNYYRNPTTSPRIKGMILHSGLQSVLSCVDPSINLHNTELHFPKQSIKQIKQFVLQQLEQSRLDDENAVITTTTTSNNKSSNPSQIHLSAIDLTPTHTYTTQTLSSHKGHFMDMLVNAVLVQYISCPILLLHGCNDRTVPIAGAHAVYDNALFCVDPLFMHNADHNDVEQQTGPIYFDTIRSFLHNICCNMFSRSIYNISRFDCPTNLQPIIKQFWHWYQDHQYQLRLYNIYAKLKHVTRQSIFKPDPPAQSKWYYCCGQISHNVQYIENILKDFFAKEAQRRRNDQLNRKVYEQVQNAIDETHT